MVYVCCIGIKNIFRYNKFKLEAEQSRLQLEKLTLQRELYQKELQSMQDDQYWEFLAKKRLGYVKPGEIVYKIVPQIN